MLRILTAVLIMSASLTAGSAQAEGLTVTVENIRNDNGSIIVLIFDNARAFDRLDHQRAVDWAEIPAHAGRVSVPFADLNAGPYAVFLFHDENGDQDLNTKGWRLLEGVGASGAPNPEDEPSFAEAAVPPGAVSVPLHYED